MQAPCHPPSHCPAIGARQEAPGRTTSQRQLWGEAERAATTTLRRRSTRCGLGERAGSRCRPPGALRRPLAPAPPPLQSEEDSDVSEEEEDVSRHRKQPAVKEKKKKRGSAFVDDAAEEVWGRWGS